MNDRAALLRATRGPLLLIALGVLFVLDQQSGAMPFYQTWPVLLILFGVFKLAERMLAPVPTVPPPPYGMAGGPGTWQQPPQGGVRQ